MTGNSVFYGYYSPTAALDGVTNNYFGHPAAPDKNGAEWWTDLADVLKMIMKYFGYLHDTILTHATVTCTEPVMGRYVHFKKTCGPEIG